jgi:hypothetical protein
VRALIDAALALHHAEPRDNVGFKVAWENFSAECARHEAVVASRRTCTVGDCVRPHRARGMCHMHLRLSKEELAR